MNNKSHVTMTLRRMLDEEHLTHAQLSALTGIPKERVHTLTRGNAPLRFHEAERIARALNRDIHVFMEQTPKEQVRLYCDSHKDEIEAFEKIITAGHALKASLQTPIDPKQTASVLKFPRQLQHDDPDPVVQIKYEETRNVDIIFEQVEYLAGKKSILLSGTQSNKKWIIEPVTAYMRRWWYDNTSPKMRTAFPFPNEHFFRERENALLRIYGDYRTKADEPDMAYFVDPEIAKLTEDNEIDKLGLPPIHDLKSATKAYEALTTKLRIYDYLHFTEDIQELGERHGAILGDSIKTRIAILRKYGGTFMPEDLENIDVQLRGLTPIHSDIDAILRDMPITELARMVIEKKQLHWFFDGAGAVIASDRKTMVAPSLSVLAREMQLAGFFGEHATGSYGHAIIWSAIHGNKKEKKSLVENLQQYKSEAEIKEVEEHYRYTNRYTK